MHVQGIYSSKVQYEGSVISSMLMLLVMRFAMESSLPAKNIVHKSELKKRTVRFGGSKAMQCCLLGSSRNALLPFAAQTKCAVAFLGSESTHRCLLGPRCNALFPFLTPMKITVAFWSPDSMDYYLFWLRGNVLLPLLVQKQHAVAFIGSEAM